MALGPQIFSRRFDSRETDDKIHNICRYLQAMFFCVFGYILDTSFESTIVYYVLSVSSGFEVHTLQPRNQKAHIDFIEFCFTAHGDFIFGVVVHF